MVDISYSKQKLLEQAEKALDRYEPLIAAKFYTRIFETEPSYEIAFQVGNCYFESLQIQPDLVELCHEWLLKSIQLNQNQWEPFLQLGQLLQGPDAVQMYEKGLQTLEKHLENNNVHIEINIRCQN